MTGQPTDAVVASATALAARHRLSGTIDLDVMTPAERTWWLMSARDALIAGLDVHRMADAYGVAQFGRREWEDAPAIIRKDVYDRMTAVITSILGETP
jgi:hypothetical protein